MRDDDDIVTSGCGNIESAVVDKNLCCGCGACVGVCPAGALTIDIHVSHEPVIDESRCTGCGLCLDVCPGQGYPVAELAGRHCDGETRMHPEQGPVRRYLKGHSTDPDIRLNSASGGIATSLLLHLLETGRVDAVSVVGMEDERPVSRLTGDPQVVRDAMMSKYGPVPVLATLIPELRKHPRRIAMTATPCQLGGWFRAAERIPRLRESEVLAIGLFCGQVQSYDALTSIAATLGVRYPGEAKFTAWRHGSYPGNTRFERSDGTAVEKSLYSSYDVAIPHFSLNRCFLCPDGENWLADMTLGDIHHGGTDETVVLCRSKRGWDALDSARNASAIVLDDMTPAEADRCVIRGITRSKLFPSNALIAWLRKGKRAVPEFDYDAGALAHGSLQRMAPFWIMRYRLILWARTGWRRRFLLKHPSLLEKIGHFLYYIPATIPGFPLAVRTGKFLARMIGKARPR